MVRRAGAILLLVAAAAQAQAQTAPPEGHSCHDGHLVADPTTMRPGIVSGKKARTYFYGGTDERDDCPGAGEVCRRNAYVVKGDKVLVAEDSAPGFVCAGFISRRGTVTAGWLPEHAVDVRRTPQPLAAAWLGKWNYNNSNLSITRGKAAGLDIEGDSWTKRYQSANTGDISGEGVTPKGNILAFAMDAGETLPIEKADKLSCVLTLALVHDVLIVYDTGNCGGAGVYFTGLYRRKR